MKDIHDEDTVDLEDILWVKQEKDTLDDIADDEPEIIDLIEDCLIND